MKIVVLHGSMRKGNTNALTKKVINQLLEKSDIEIVEFSVAKMNLPFCLSCHLCFSKGEEYCPNFEHIKDFKQALDDSDGLILSGTTYMWSLNAAAKNVLDHLSYNFHRPMFFGKKGMVIATSAGNGEKTISKYFSTVLRQWGVNGAVVLTKNSKQEILWSEKKTYRTIKRATNKFYMQLVRKKYIKPTLKTIAVHNTFRCMSLSKFAEYEKDTEFWKQDKNNKAYPVKIGLFRYCIGALVFRLANIAVKIIGRKVNKKNEHEISYNKKK